MNKEESKKEAKQAETVAAAKDEVKKDEKADKVVSVTDEVVTSDVKIKADKKVVDDADADDDAEKADAADEKDAKDVKDAKAVKSAKKAVKASDDADADVEDDEDDEEAEKAAEKDEEPAPVEPDSIFIDHGAILPEYVPGTCLYALVRDPGTLFVYWNATFESSNGWLLTAYDAAGRVLQSFTTPARRNGRGYFRVPTASVARVTLSILTGYGSSEVKLESRIRIAEQLGIAQPKPAVDERWVDFQNHEVIYEAPAPGRAPESHEVYESMKAPGVISGGIDRAEDGEDVSVSAGGCSLSSRFGRLNAPGSSDVLVSSGCLVRR